MNSMNANWLTGLGLSLVALTAAAQTTPIVTDLGNPQNGGSNIYGSGPPGEYAQQFVTGSQTFQLADVIALLGSGSTSASYSVSAELVTDNSGSPGSTVVTTFNSLSSVPTAYTQEMFAPTSTVDLAANTDYWLIISGASTATSSLFKWGYTNTLSSSFPEYAHSTNSGSTWTINSTSGPFLMEVDGVAPVPLPASAWLMISGLLGAGALVRRRAGWAVPAGRA